MDYNKYNDLIVALFALIKHMPKNQNLIDDYVHLYKILDNLNEYLASFKDVQQLEIEYQMAQITMKRIIKGWTDSTAAQITDAYIARISNPIYSVQEGQGHLVYFNGCPAACLIRPAFYEMCKPLPIETICMIIEGRQIVIAMKESVWRCPLG